MRKKKKKVIDFLFSEGTMTEKFTTYLKENGVYEEFMKNLKENSSHDSLEEYVEVTSPYDLIYVASQWKNSSMIVGPYFPARGTPGIVESWDEIEYSWRCKFCEGCEDPECLSLGTRQHCYYRDQPFDF